MRKWIKLNGRLLYYELEYKDVRNINLRIRPDGSIYVSANRRHPKDKIELILRSNTDKILNTLDHIAELKKSAAKIQRYDSDEEERICRERVKVYLAKYYPSFKKACAHIYPEVHFRRLSSRWGSCTPLRFLLTFNTRLAYVPDECLEYIVVHEFCHFAHPDHSAQFYDLLSSYIPDWKERREELRKYEGLMI